MTLHSINKAETKLLSWQADLCLFLILNQLRIQKDFTQICLKRKYTNYKFLNYICVGNNNVTKFQKYQYRENGI